MDTKIRALIAKINKEHGDNTLILGSEALVPKRYTTGSLAIDVALGGGWPANQWVEVLGKESAAKTSLVLKGVAANQKLDPDFTTLWIAAEHYNAEWAAKLGVDNSRVIVHATQKMEEAYSVMLDFAASKAVDWIVLDSYPALIPDEEARKDMDETVVAIGARLTNKFFRKAGDATKRSLTEHERPILGIFINQWRDVINSGWTVPGADVDISPGGKGKNYAFYVRLDVIRGAQITENRPQQEGKALTVKVGQTVRIVTKKNKSAPPLQVASVDFYFRDAATLGFKQGEFDTAKESITMGILFGVIERAGPTYRFRSYSWKGKDAMLAAIKESPEIQAEIRQDVLEASTMPELAGLTEKDLTEAERAGEKKVARKTNAEE